MRCGGVPRPNGRAGLTSTRPPLVLEQIEQDREVLLDGKRTVLLWPRRLDADLRPAEASSDRLLLAEGCSFRRVRQRQVRAGEYLGEITLPDLYRGGPELAQQRVGRLAGERADVEALQLGTAGPE